MIDSIRKTETWFLLLVLSEGGDDDEVVRIWANKQTNIRFGQINNGLAYERPRTERNEKGKSIALRMFGIRLRYSDIDKSLVNIRQWLELVWRFTTCLLRRQERSRWRAHAQSTDPLRYNWKVLHMNCTLVRCTIASSRTVRVSNGGWSPRSCARIESVRQCFILVISSAERTPSNEWWCNNRRHVHRKGHRNSYLEYLAVAIVVVS